MSDEFPDQGGIAHRHLSSTEYAMSSKYESNPNRGAKVQSRARARRQKRTWSRQGGPLGPEGQRISAALPACAHNDPLPPTCEPCSRLTKTSFLHHLRQGGSAWAVGIGVVLLAAFASASLPEPGSWVSSSRPGCVGRPPQDQLRVHQSRSLRGRRNVSIPGHAADVIRGTIRQRLDGASRLVAPAGHEAAPIHHE